MTVLTIGSLLTSAVGAGVQYQGMQRAAAAQEAAAEYNAKQLERKARFDADVTAENARRLEKKKQRRLASIRAKAAGSGVSYTGSVAMQLEEGAVSLTQDIQDQVFQSSIRQRDLRERADVTLYEGASRAAGTRASANASLLTSAGSLARNTYDGYHSGSFRIGG